MDRFTLTKNCGLFVCTRDIIIIQQKKSIIDKITQTAKNTDYLYEIYEILTGESFVSLFTLFLTFFRVAFYRHFIIKYCAKSIRAAVISFGN
jgi:hypothetical protein